MTTYINIGLSTKEVLGGGLLDVETVLATLRALCVDAKDHAVRMSGTEPTFVATIAQPLSPIVGYTLAVTLHQQAIVQRTGEGEGDLFGPAAEAWAPYQESLFVLPL